MSESTFGPTEHGRVGGSRAGKIAYALLFTVVLPVLLASWARALDRNVEFAFMTPASGGWVLAAGGLFLVAGAVIVLRVRGRGWPMSPYPPERLVTTGVYALVAHPIYVGSVLASFGVALAAGSPAGLFVVAPVLAIACVAFVVGYESELTASQLGSRTAPPVLRLPDTSGASPSLADRLSVYVLVFLPWYLLVEGVNALGTSAEARRAYMPWELSLPVVGWTELFYFSGYVIALAAPLVAGSRRELRGFVFRGWLAVTVVITVYLAFPVSCQAKPVPEESAFATMLRWERMFEEPDSAFPSFHVIWAMLAMQVIVRRFPRWRVAGWLLVTAVSISCVTTGMHAIADIVAGVGFGFIFMNARELWAFLIRVCESVAASWLEVKIGRLRFINHGIWAALGGMIGLLVVFSLQPGQAVAVIVVAIASIAGAGLWAQWLEGSSALLRPYGFYGGLLGGLVAIAVWRLMDGDAMGLLAAYAVGVPFAQAIGRLRCLVQGCCHGRPTDAEIGMRYRHPSSRVVRLAGLKGIPLHATQMYSILGNVLIGVLLVRAWQAALPLSVIAGFYFILSGLQRFVEEHYRGEPQTKVISGLRIYQWLAIAGVVGGAALQTMPSMPAPPARGLSLPTIGIALALFGVAYVAYGVDFPGSSRRFSRLSS